MINILPKFKNHIFHQTKFLKNQEKSKLKKQLKKEKTKKFLIN